MSAIKVGAKILPSFRNCGASYGLQYPFIWSRVNDRCAVWHRVTGLIVFVAEKVGPNLWEGFEDLAASKECERLNALVHGLDHLPVDLAAIDATP